MTDQILSTQQLEWARDWIKDCSWREDFEPEEVDEMTDQDVIKGISKHYCGGLDEFKRSCD